MPAAAAAKPFSMAALNSLRSVGVPWVAITARSTATARAPPPSAPPGMLSITSMTGQLPYAAAGCVRVRKISRSRRPEERSGWSRWVSGGGERGRG